MGVCVWSSKRTAAVVSAERVPGGGTQAYSASTRKISTTGGERRISLNLCIQSPVFFFEPTPS